MPKIEKVIDAKRNTQTGAGLSWSSTNGGAPVFRIMAGNIDTPVGKAMQEVRTAVDNNETSAEEITNKLNALNDARNKARGSGCRAKGIERSAHAASAGDTVDNGGLGIASGYSD